MKAYRELEILKDDIMGSVWLIELQDKTQAICRRYKSASWIVKPISFLLAKREANMLRLLESLPENRAPRLLTIGKGELIRTYIKGQPLNKIQVPNERFYSSALELVKKMHACGVVHNDLEKPENWVVNQEQEPCIIDFQLALKPSMKWLFRMLAHEDVRHVLKQKRRFCSVSLSVEENALLQKRSGLGKLWKTYFKPIYNFVTRKIFRYSDRENSRYSR